MVIIIPWDPDSSVKDHNKRNEILDSLAPLDVSFTCEQSVHQPFHWTININFKKDDDRQMMFWFKYGELCSK